MKKQLFIFNLSLFVILQIGAQDLTQDYRKIILNSPNNVSVFQSNSTNGIWASGMINLDRWGVFEDATSSKERLTILPGGNVGINATNPLSLFQIGGVYESSNSYMTFGKRVSSPEVNLPYIGHDSYEGVGNDIAIGARSSNGSVNFYTGTHSAQFNKSNLRIRILNDGNVGIGTASSKSLLQLGDSNILSNNYITFGKRVSTPEVNLPYIGHDSYEGVGNDIAIGTRSSNGSINFYTGAHTNQFNSSNLKMRVLNNGYVGIGTTTPDSKLTVAGKIHAQEVKVTVAAGVTPDYVFKKDYDLKTLEEVQDYIDKEGHLSNIPSAKEIETNGLLLKEMNLKLLEKIEELTLYTINQEKRIKNLEKENNTLKTQQEKISALEAKVNLLLNLKP